MFNVLSLVANVRPQSWPSLIDGLVDDSVLQLSPDRNDKTYTVWRLSLLSNVPHGIEHNGTGKG